MKKTEHGRIIPILLVLCAFIAIVGVSVLVTLKNSTDLRSILSDSVQSQLLSTSLAAREIIDVEKFDSYNTPEDVARDAASYEAMLGKLRSLQTQVGAEYIYALKQLNGEYYFIFDTDSEDEEIFVKYTLTPVHERAFLGEQATVMDVVDEYGVFNIGAVPIFKQGKVIGIICTDFADEFVAKSAKTARTNAIALIASLSLVLALIFLVVIILLRKNREMKKKLYQMANYDVITGLPNRQYLMDYLAVASKKSQKTGAPYALLFIDLDNFKRVNDNAGHDAGDELLRHIALYLDTIHEHSKSFRPSAGMLNISARVGGDEFIQVIPGIGDAAEAEMVVKKVLDNFSSNTLDRYVEKYQVGMSIGVALYPYHTDNYNVLIKYADIAMYHAKKSGKNTYCVYHDEMAQKDEK